MIENIQNSVLTILIRLLSGIINDIPIKLFFGVNTMYHKILNQFSTMSNIQLKKIYLADSISAFEDTFKYLFIENNLHYIIHPKILNTLTDQFFTTNLSV